MMGDEYLNWLLSSDDRPIPPPRRRKMERQARLLGAEPVPDNEFPRYILSGQTGILKDYTAAVPIGYHQEVDALAFLHSMIHNTKTMIEDELQREGGIKFTLILKAEVEKFSKNGDTISTTPYFHSGSEPVLHTGEAQERLHAAVNKVMERLESFTNEGSGWRLKRCATLTLKISRYQPFRGQSYIKTPAYIPPRTVINVKKR
jgi:ribosome-associated translation inhibitor RaiA